MAAAGKLDLRKTHRDEYVARRKPALIDAGRARYLTITGRGEPGGQLFQRQLSAVFATAFAIKMAKKGAGRDFRMMPLEGLWWAPKSKVAATPQGTWNWTLMVRVPPYVGKRDLAVAVKLVAANPDAKLLPVSKLTLQDITEGRCVQMLHVGPYDTEPASMTAMHEFATAQGLRLTGRHHEIYFSDPGRSRPEKMKTLLRYPVTRSR